MSRSVQQIHELFVGTWPRVIGFSNSPSLLALALALVANLVSLIPNPLRVPRESVAGPFCPTALEQNTQAGKGNQL